MTGGKMVPVVTEKGEKLGEVKPVTTSVGASKVAGGPVEFSRRFGYWAWIKKAHAGPRPMRWKKG